MTKGTEKETARMTIHRSKLALVSILTLTFVATGVHATDWPRWLGPNGDNISPEAAKFEPDLAKWKVAWSGNVGLGYSSVAIAGNRAYTMGHDGKSQETILCLDAATGAEIWKKSYKGQ